MTFGCDLVLYFLGIPITLAIIVRIYELIYKYITRQKPPCEKVLEFKKKLKDDIFLKKNLNPDLNKKSKCFPY